MLTVPKNVYSGEVARTTAPYASHCNEKRAIIAAAQNYFAAKYVLCWNLSR